MSDEPTPLRIRKRRLVDYRNRGAIYRWLRAHHARVKSLLNTGEATWPRLCAEMARHGVLDRMGAAPTPNPATKVWRRLCDELGDSQAAYRFKNYPSRIPKDWKPEVVPPPTVEPAPRGQLTPGIHPLGTSLIRTPPSENAVTGRKLTGEEKLARLEAELASRRSG